MPYPVDVTLHEARAVALAAQAFSPRAIRRPGSVQIRRLVDRLQAVQVDPINVVTRAQYLPVYARLGDYDARSFDALVDGRRLVELMAHEASIVPVRLWPLLQWRMDAARRDPRTPARYPDGLLDRLVAEITVRGPVTASELDDGALPRERWGRAGATQWTTNPIASALRRLGMQGRVVTAARRGTERVFDVPERVIPDAVLHAPAVPPDDARRTLLLLAARALGLATASDLADYFRFGSGASGHADRHHPALAPVSQLLGELVGDGSLRVCRVEGWSQPAYMPTRVTASRDAPAPRALLSPFDSLVWCRERVRRLFGFSYKVEIYVPREKREHGYYVMPFLLGDRLVARVDLQADRKQGCLVARGAFVEPHAQPKAVASELAAELTSMAGWLELERVVVENVGDLAPALGRAMRSRARG